MRKSLVIAASLLFVITSAFAQQTTPSNSVSVFVSDLSVTHTSSNGTSFDAGREETNAKAYLQDETRELRAGDEAVRQMIRRVGKRHRPEPDGRGVERQKLRVRVGAVIHAGPGH